MDSWLELVESVGGHMQARDEPLDKLVTGQKRGLGQCMKAIETYEEDRRREAAQQEKQERKTA